MVTAKPVSSYTKPKRKVLKIVLLSILALILGIGIYFGTTIYNTLKKITSFSSGGNILSLFNSGGTTLKGQSDGRTNILLLGYGGAGHSGAYLTDTIMVLSINWKDKKAAMISVPRDLWVPISGDGSAKINEAYSFGVQNKSAGGGGAVASETVSNILGIPIHYFVAVDFDGFKEIIDKVGGVDINVPNAFTDRTYPAGECINNGPGCGYITVHFDTGNQHMDGTTALEFARSRHGNNGEGSDFARSRRQQLVLEAVKQKILKASVLANPITVTDLLGIVSDHFSTSLSPAEIKSLWDTTKSIDTANMTTKVLDNSANGVLIDSVSSGGAYILLPKKGAKDFSDLQAIAKNIFNMASDTSAKIEVLNGSGKTGAAKKVADALETLGYNVVKTGDAAEVAQSQVYNCSGDETSSTAEDLANKLSTDVQTKDSCGTIDIEVVIGQNYNLNE